MTSPMCRVTGCLRDCGKGANGLCGMHNMRVKRGKPVGEAGYVRAPGRSLSERVYPALTADPATGCWEWQGALRNGYGAVGRGKQVVYVHRWVYEDMVAEIPHGLVIDHLCNNRACANPEHLDPVTRAVNNARGRHGAIA